MTESTDLVRQQLESSLDDSLDTLVREHADNPMLLLDLSGSMSTQMANGRRRIDGLRDVLTQITGVTMIAFGGQETSEPRFVDSAGEPGGGTPLAAAINLAKTYGATRAVVISDGLPDNSVAALDSAKAFEGKIDVVFVGDLEGYEGRQGSDFLDRLARLTGGTRIEGDLRKTKEITGKVLLMLEGEVAPATKTVFAGGVATEVPVEEEAEPDEDEDDDDEDDDEE